MLERDKTFNDILDRIEAMEARLEDLRDVSRPAEVVVVEQPEWQALAGWVSTGSVLRDIDGKIILDPNIPRIQIAADGYIESADFVTGVSGFQIDGGMAEFNNVTIRGTIYADAGEIGGWDIGTYTITADSGAVGLNSEATGGTDIRIWAGHATPGSAPFRVDETGALVASSANITGTIDANAGHIGTLDIDGVLTVGAGAPVIQLDGPNTRVRSSNYAAGLAGFNIEADGDAEFNNVTVRGALHSPTFVKDLIEARAGTLIIVKSAGVLANDMAVPGAGTWSMYINDPPGGGFLFANGDVCRCKSEYSGGIADVWFTVASRTDMGDGRQRYTCTYQNGTKSVTYPEGAPVLDYGTSGDGGILQTADLTNAPYLSVFTHAGSPWATVTERLRLGNLAGWQGAGLTGYGIAMGDYAGNEYAYYEPGSGLAVRGTITADDGTLVDLSVTGTLSLSGSGKLITAASPNPRIELTTSLLAGYSDATTKEFYLDATDGKARAGAGKILIDSDAFIKFTDGADNVYGSIGWVDGFGLADPMVVVKALKAASYAKLNLEGVDGSAVMGGYNDAVTRERWLICGTAALTYGDAEGGLINPYFTVNYEGKGGLYGLSVGDPTKTPDSGEIRLYRGSTLMGQFSTSDTTWFRINQDVAKNIYTPRYIRADGGLVAGNLTGASGELRCTGDARIGSGLYVGGNSDPDPNDIHFEGNLKSVKAATHDVYGYKALASGLTHTSWDGDDTKAVGTHLVDMSAFGVPSEATAVVGITGGSWAASSDGNYSYIRPNGGSANEAACLLRAKGTGYQDGEFVCKCGTNRDLQLIVAGLQWTSVYLRIIGYFI